MQNENDHTVRLINGFLTAHRCVKGNFSQ